MTPEKRFENQIKRFLRKHGIYECGTRMSDMVVKPNGWFYKVAGSGGQRAGIPDYQLCICGRACYIETKAADGTPSALQVRTIDHIRRAGGNACILYPNGWQDMQDTIERMIYDGDFRQWEMFYGCRARRRRTA